MRTGPIVLAFTSRKPKRRRRPSEDGLSPFLKKMRELEAFSPDYADVLLGIADSAFQNAGAQTIELKIGRIRCDADERGGA